MMALVADYAGSSSSDDEDDNNTSERKTIRADGENAVNFFQPSLDDGTNPPVDSDSSSSSSEPPAAEADEPTDEPLRTASAPIAGPRIPLPSPFSGAHKSVFTTPLRAEQAAREGVLQKHVQLSEHRLAETRGGKQICWKARQGKCRRGAKCRFLHDSEVVRPGEEPPKPDRTPQIAAPSSVDGKPPAFLGEGMPHHAGRGDTEDDTGRTARLGKKRGGVTDTLQPTKAFKKAYAAQQQQQGYGV